MTILLSDAGKRFNREWIFRHLTYTFEEGKTYAITGPNGSGKSTLLQVLAGAMHVNEGTIAFEKGSRINSEATTSIAPEQVYRQISYCAPYLEVVEEMTLEEFLQFHHGFKPFMEQISIPQIISLIGLESAARKQIRYYSSGMKQRVKLAQAIFTTTPAIFLDAPCTDLDLAGIELYHSLIENYAKSKLIVVSSNDEVEYRFCEQRISITEYK